MNKVVISIIVAITFVLLGAGVFFITKSSAPKPGQYDNFAKCLAEKKVTMYGAYWCPHCINTKKSFGDSFRFVPYVECTVETKLCTEKDINGYPTWIFQDGSRLSGEVPLKEIAEKSGCAL